MNFLVTYNRSIMGRRRGALCLSFKKELSFFSVSHASAPSCSAQHDAQLKKRKYERQHCKKFSVRGLWKAINLKTSCGQSKFLDAKQAKAE